MGVLEQAASFQSLNELSVQEWCDERCAAVQGSRLDALDAYTDYERWAAACGKRPVSRMMFSRSILASNVHRLRSNGSTYFVGLQIKVEQHPI